LPGDVLDTANWTWREYGQRVGVWRMIEMFDKVGVKPSRTINGLTMTERRRVVDACNERRWGLAYCDYLNDDQPYLIHTSHGPIVCVPYSNDINDFNLFARGGMSAAAGLETLKICFDQLYAEGWIADAS
jgi:hypothetical protein